MKLINETKSVDLDESYSKNKDKSNSDSLIPDNFYESKTASIFDDDFQGIEWPVGKKQHRHINNDNPSSLDSTLINCAEMNLSGSLWYDGDDDY